MLFGVKNKRSKDFFLKYYLQSIRWAMTSFVEPRFLGLGLTNYLWSSALICVQLPAPRCPVKFAIAKAYPVASANGTGTQRNSLGVLPLSKIPSFDFLRDQQKLC
jgi:hypothetical protein